MTKLLIDLQLGKVQELINTPRQGKPHQADPFSHFFRARANPPQDSAGDVKNIKRRWEKSDKTSLTTQAKDLHITTIMKNIALDNNAKAEFPQSRGTSFFTFRFAAARHSAPCVDFYLHGAVLSRRCKNTVVTVVKSNASMSSLIEVLLFMFPFFRGGPTSTSSLTHSVNSLIAPC